MPLDIDPVAVVSVTLVRRDPASYSIVLSSALTKRSNTS